MYLSLPPFGDRIEGLVFEDNGPVSKTALPAHVAFTQHRAQLSDHRQLGHLLSPVQFLCPWTEASSVLVPRGGPGTGQEYSCGLRDLMIAL